MTATARADDTQTSSAESVTVEKTGTVAFRASGKEKDVPKLFRMTNHSFPFETEFIRNSGAVRVYKVRFPSPVKTAVPENNTVYGHYFQPEGKGPFPGVIVLHILGGDFALSQMIANGLAHKKVAALFIKLPYYGERRGPKKRFFISFEPKETKANFIQGVLDIRRAAAWLSSRPEVDSSQMGITGISLGGIMSALAAPSEPLFRKVAIYLGGGNLGELVWNLDHRAAAAFRKSWLSRGETRDSFISQVGPVDPITYGHLLKDRTVIMVAAKNDVIVPPKSTKALWEAMGRQPKLIWLEAGHYSAVRYLYSEMERMGKFFQPESKTSNRGGK